jgi:MFS family permease
VGEVEVRNGRPRIGAMQCNNNSHTVPSSDVYGRRSVLLHTLAVSTIFQIFFGLSTSMTWVLFWRISLGLFNCIPGLLKTVISESCDDATWVSDTTGLVFGMWGVGFLISPLVSGALADPVGQYGDVAIGENV